MKAPPSISIIIPAWNAARFLSATLASVQAQTVQEWECIVVNNGSTDTTEQLVSEWSRTDPRFCLISIEEKNQCRARNAGFSKSSSHSTYITFLDADDVWLPDALELLRNELERHNEAVAAHGLADIIDEDGVVTSPGTFADFGRNRLGYDNGRIRSWSLSEPTCFACLVWAFHMFPPGVLLTRRRCYERVGLFDDSLQRGVDWDIAIRISREGPIRFLDQVVIFYRMHQLNLSKGHNTDQNWIRRIWAKTLESPANTKEHRRILRDGWVAWERFMALERAKMAGAAFGRMRCRKGIVHLLSMFNHSLRSIKAATRA